MKNKLVFALSSLIFLNINSMEDKSSKSTNLSDNLRNELSEQDCLFYLQMIEEIEELKDIDSQIRLVTVIFEKDKSQAKKFLAHSARNGNIEVTKAFINAHQELKEYAVLMLCEIIGRINQCQNEEDIAKELVYFETLLDEDIDLNIEVVLNKGDIYLGQTIREQITLRPLIVAGCCHNSMITKLLLAHGADVNAESNGISALYVAIDALNPYAISFLLNNGAHISNTVEQKIFDMMHLFLALPQMADIMDSFIGQPQIDASIENLWRNWKEIRPLLNATITQISSEQQITISSIIRHTAIFTRLLPIYIELNNLKARVQEQDIKKLDKITNSIKYINGFNQAEIRQNMANEIPELDLIKQILEKFAKQNQQTQGQQRCVLQ